jgi:hypothetical protein
MSDPIGWGPGPHMRPAQLRSYDAAGPQSCSRCGTLRPGPRRAQVQGSYFLRVPLPYGGSVNSMYETLLCADCHDLFVRHCWVFFGLEYRP